MKTDVIPADVIRPADRRDEAPYSSHAPIDREAWRDILLAFAVTRLALVGVGLLAVFYIYPLLKGNPIGHVPGSDTRLPDALWLLWLRFDGSFYVDIAKHGYWPPLSLHHASNWVFYPLYPLVIRPFATLFGSSDTAYRLAGIAVSNAATLAALSYLYALVRREWGRAVAARAVLYTALFPTGFYLSAIYPHALFLACAVASLYHARRREWWHAGLWGGLAALTRAEGLLLLVPLSWEYARALAVPSIAPHADGGPSSGRVSRRPWALMRSIRGTRARGSPLALALVPVGTLLFLAYAGLQTGDPLASPHNEAHWGRRFTLPWTTLLHSLTNPAPASGLAWNFWPLNNVLAVLGLLAVLAAFRRLPVSLALYLLVTVVYPLCSGSMQSLGRYYLAAFPVAILLALWSNRRPSSARTYAVVGAFAALQAALMVFFALGLPAMA